MFKRCFNIVFKIYVLKLFYISKIRKCKMEFTTFVGLINQLSINGTIKHF